MANIGATRFGLPCRAVCWGLFAIGLALVFYRIVIAPRDEIDFRFFWLAGKLWTMGIDPYTPAYGAMSTGLLPAGNITPAWPYPPHWWPVCTLLAQFTEPHAVMLWRLASAAMVIGGTWWLAFTLFPQAARAEIAAGVAGLACLIEPTVNTIAFGQAGALWYIGLVAIAVGAARGQTWALALGALILSLKPPLAVPVLLAMLIVPRFRLAVVIGGVAGVLLTLPQVIPFGLSETLHGWLGNLSHYTDNRAGDPGPNSVLASTGPLQLLARIVDVGATPMVQVPLAMAVAAVAAVMLRVDRPDRRTGGLMLLLAAEVSLLPLHIYDFTLILVPLLLLAHSIGRVTWPMALVVALTIRPAKIENMLHVPLYGGGVSAGTIGLSIAGLLLLALVVLEIRRLRTAQPPMSLA